MSIVFAGKGVELFKIYYNSHVVYRLFTNVHLS